MNAFKQKTQTITMWHICIKTKEILVLCLIVVINP